MEATDPAIIGVLILAMIICLGVIVANLIEPMDDDKDK